MYHCFRFAPLPQNIGLINLQLRASYPIVDHRERQIAPHSLSFNLTMDKCVRSPKSLELVYLCTRQGDSQ